VVVFVFAIITPIAFDGAVSGAAPAELSRVSSLLKYRADIDGLRAIAVILVVLFHLDVNGFHGGYVGVDVFFVISGYLITSIIKHKHENHNFEFADFYSRRIRRLVPPLIVTVAVTMAAGAFVMTPYDLSNLSRSAVAALFSLSNILFYLESGYWDTASELKPLLHTWSLGVEEQFYLFWPAIILGLLSIQRYISFGTSLAVISGLGAALCIGYTSIDQSAAFYLLPFRIFQFSVGALLIPLMAVLVARSPGRPFPFAVFFFPVGILCILISAVAFDGDTLFPGFAVLLPTLGAAMVLLSGVQAHGPKARLLMENPLSLWLGRVSYAMYLVHWPLIALFRYVYGLELTVADQIILVLLTLVATFMLHYGVEKRFYRRASPDSTEPNTRSDSKFIHRTVAAVCFVSLLASSAWLGDGWSWRFPSLSLSTAQIEQGLMERTRRMGSACKLVGWESNSRCDLEAETQMLVLGTSTEVDGYNFINAGYGGDSNLNLIAFGGTQGCSKLREQYGHFYSKEERCQQQLDALFRPDFISKLDLVLYSANRPYDQNKSIHLSMLKELKARKPDLRVITLGGYINTRRKCAYYINKTSTTDSCALPENVSYFEDDPQSQFLYEEFQEIETLYIDRVELLCKSRILQTCRMRTNTGIPALYDRVHNSLEFAEMSGILYAQKHANLLQELGNR
jgi:peptidoglycan/LPS O-acetylase OafA/YrhL